MYIAARLSGKAPNFLIRLSSDPFSTYSIMMFKSLFVSIESVLLTMMLTYILHNIRVIQFLEQVDFTLNALLHLLFLLFVFLHDGKLKLFDRD